MRYFRYVSLLPVVCIFIFAISVEASTSVTEINFHSLDKSQSYNLHGKLYLPESCPTPCPAVVVVHGTNGIDSRGEFYRQAVVNSRIAFFEVDFKTGVFTGPNNRPKNVTFIPMAFAALKELRKLSAIDPNRIGIMGFSLGGGLTVRSSFEAYRKKWMGDESGFAAHAAFYPASKYIKKNLEESGSGLTGAPMIIFYGTEDCYGDGTAAPELKSLLDKKYNFNVTLVEYPGVAHGFNKNAPPLNFKDPAAIGEKGYIAWDAKAANDSLTQVIAFLRKSLAVR